MAAAENTEHETMRKWLAQPMTRLHVEFYSILNDHFTVFKDFLVVILNTKGDNHR